MIYTEITREAIGIRNDEKQLYFRIHCPSIEKYNEKKLCYDTSKHANQQ